MKITEIYSRYNIPPNLSEHMFRVFGVVRFIGKHWLGNNVDWNLVETLALLHDLGNIVKFDFEKHPEFLGDEVKNINHWKQVQKEVIEKYGDNDHLVTEQMLRELGFDEDIIVIPLSKSFDKSIATMNSGNWPLKILYYADLRTLPFGIGTLEARISDVRGRMSKYTNRPDFEDIVKACFAIEAQIQKNINLPVSDITTEAISDFVASASKFEVETNNIRI